MSQRDTSQFRLVVGLPPQSRKKEAKQEEAPFVPLPKNPITRIREETGKTARAFAQELGVSHQFVCNAEAGQYESVPPKYHRRLKPGDIVLYQEYRSAVRKRNFKPEDFPETPKNFQEILDHLGETVHSFSRKICVQQPDIMRIVQKRNSLIPQSIIRAFADIGVPVTVLISLSEYHNVILTESRTG